MKSGRRRQRDEKERGAKISAETENTNDAGKFLGQNREDFVLWKTDEFSRNCFCTLR